MTLCPETFALRVLCISPLFAPAASAEGFCAGKMAQALHDSGVSVTVLASSNLFGIRPDGSRVWDSLQDITVDVPQVAGSNTLESIAAAVRLQTRGYARWVASVVKKSESLHQQKPFDVIYSRSMPMAAHIAGFWCAKKLGLPWIANINDPWEFSLYHRAGAAKASPVAARGLLFWLRRTLRSADLVTYPCEGLHRFHAELANLNHPARIIPHIGRRPERANPQITAPDGQFRLVHAGMLGALDQTGRSANSLLLGLKAFVSSSPEAAAGTKLVLVGPEDQQTQAQVRELGLEQNVESVGRVDYETSLDYMASASACILLEAEMNEGIFFPSKLADYIACGKPVLAISPRMGTVADLANCGELIRADHDSESIRNAIAALYAEHAHGTLESRAPTVRQIHEFQAPTVANEFLSACTALRSRHLSEPGQNPTEAWTQVRRTKHLSESSAENTR